MSKGVKNVTKKKTETVIYIGPSIKNVVVTGTVLLNELPKKLKEAVAARPQIGNLIVPVKQLAKAQCEVDKAGSALNMIYKKVEEEQGGVR